MLFGSGVALKFFFLGSKKFFFGKSLRTKKSLVMTKKKMEPMTFFFITEKKPLRFAFFFVTQKKRPVPK